MRAIPIKRRFRRKRRAESDEFLWLVSLSDLMMLLFMFFLVMFSFTHKKMQKIDIERMIAALRNQKTPANPLDGIRASVEQWIARNHKQGEIEVEKNSDGVFIQIKDKVLFPIGEYQVHEDGLKAVASLASILKGIPSSYHIGIEGHTDDNPIHTPSIEDNWELSAKRAMAVLRALNLPDEVLKRTSAVAHGDTCPLVPNRDSGHLPLPLNQIKNRRVTVRIF